MTSDGMTENELRAMVRESIARVAAKGPTQSPPPPQSRMHAQAHASHGLFPVLRGGDGDGMCLIEPSVRCNHCGYCLSYGH